MLREIYELYPDLGRATLPFVILDPEREPAAQTREAPRAPPRFPFYGLKIQATMIQSDVGALLNEGRGFLDFAAEFNLPFHHSFQYRARRHVVAGLRHSGRGGSNSERALLSRAFLPLRSRVVWTVSRSCPTRGSIVPRTASTARASSMVTATCAKAGRRFQADYRDPSAVLLALAEAYPTKLIWGSDTPFQSYVADIDGKFVSLRSTYAEETACVAAPCPNLRSKPRVTTTFSPCFNSKMPTFSLAGNCALVTGSSQGIGYAIAQAFMTAGARVVFHGKESGRAGCCRLDAAYLAADLLKPRRSRAARDRRFPRLPRPRPARLQCGQFFRRAVPGDGSGPVGVSDDWI